MKTDSTRDKPFACEAWSEHQASLDMARTIEQNRQDDVRAANRESDKKKQDRKESMNQDFWYRVWVGCNTLLLLIIVYAAYQFLAR